MKNIPSFNRDVLGIMLSCYLTDIEKRTNEDCGAIDFQTKVLKNSSTSVKTWFESCKDREDPLSPLNFNYC